MAQHMFTISADHKTIRRLHQQEIPNPEINMISAPSEGDEKINQLYNQCGKGKPIRFKFILSWFSSPRINYMQIKDDDECNEIMKRCMDQWSFYACQYGDKYRQEEIEEDHNPNSTTTCICSQYIQNIFYYRNKINGNILRIGCVCILKFARGTAMQEDYNIIKKLFRSCLRCNKTTLCTEIRNNLCLDCCPSIRDKRVCMSCLRLRKSKYNLCKKCWKEGNYKILVIPEQQVKSCSKCNKSFYVREDWMKICRSCWEQKNISKTCDKCHTSFYTDLEWKTTCGSCYKLYSAVCSKCENKFLPKGPWQKVCYPCWKQGKK